MRPKTGMRFGRFEVEQRLAIGGMAEIYVAREAGDDQRVVLKLLLPQLCRDAEFVQMLADEANLTSALDHPGLVKTISYEGGAQPHLVMEYVDGCSLAELLRKHGHLPPSLALAVGQQLLAALQYIHGHKDERGESSGVIHRDVTPGNVFLAKDGTVKLGDFGIARSSLRSARTRTGVIKGTIQYMSPEQVMGDVLDHRSDIYGVGLLLFEMLTGEPFIQAEREVDLLRFAENPTWRPPSRVRLDLPSSLDRLLEPALKAFPEQRYPDAETMAGALKRCLQSLTDGTEADQLGELVVRAAAERQAEQHTNPGFAATEAAAPPFAGSEETGADQGLPQAPRKSGRIIVLAVLGALFAGSLGLWLLVTTGTEPRANLGKPPRKPASALQPKAKWLDGGGAPVDVADPPAVKHQVQAKPSDAGVRHDLQRRRKTPRKRRGKRVPRPNPAPKIKAVADPRHQRTLATLRKTLTTRGVLLSDLAPALRQELAALQRAVVLPAANPSELESRLAALRSQLDAQRVDRPFVKRKLGRADRRLRSLPATHHELQGLKKKATQALIAFMEGRYQQANTLLNSILRQAR